MSWTGKRSASERRVLSHGKGFQDLEQARPGVPVGARGAVDDVVALQRRDRHGPQVRQAEVGGDRGEVGAHAGVDVGVEADQVDLVDGHHHVRHPQQRGHGEVAPGLLQDALAGVHQQHDGVGGGRAGDGVAGVLHVPGAVGQDEGPVGRGEVAVGHVDGDALLALGAQAVGQQGQVGVGEAAVARDPLDGVELVGEHRLGVVQQPADQGGLAVVHRAGGGEAEQGGCAHQK